MMPLTVAKRICLLGGGLGFYVDTITLAYLEMFSNEPVEARYFAKKLIVKDNVSGVEIIKPVKVSNKGSCFVQFLSAEVKQMGLENGIIRAFTIRAE